MKPDEKLRYVSIEEFSETTGISQSESEALYAVKVDGGLLIPRFMLDSAGVTVGASENEQPARLEPVPFDDSILDAATAVSEATDASTEDFEASDWIGIDDRTTALCEEHGERQSGDAEEDPNSLTVETSEDFDAFESCEDLESVEDSEYDEGVNKPEDVESFERSEYVDVREDAAGLDHPKSFEHTESTDNFEDVEGLENFNDDDGSENMESRLFIPNAIKNHDGSDTADISDVADSLFMSDTTDLSGTTDLYDNSGIAESSDLTDTSDIAGAADIYEIDDFYNNSDIADTPETSDALDTPDTPEAELDSFELLKNRIRLSQSQMQASATARFFARIFDLALFAIPPTYAYLLFGYLLINPSSPSLQMITVVAVASVCIVIALFLDTFCYVFAGNTPGKALLTLRVADSTGNPLSFKDYLFRNFSLLARGLAFLIFPFSLLTLFMQFRRVNDDRPTSYDLQRGTIVEDDSSGILIKSIFAIVLVLTLLIAIGGASQLIRSIG